MKSCTFTSVFSNFFFHLLEKLIFLELFRRPRHGFSVERMDYTNDMARSRGDESKRVLQ